MSTKREVFPDAGQVAEAVGQRLRTLVSGPGVFRIALSGGSTPQALYTFLAQDGVREQLPWSRLELFFSDERAVGPDSAESNYGAARQALLSKVEVKVHRMRAEDGAAEEYEKLVRARVPTGTSGLPTFDLILLGLGADGHTASLFPRTAALKEKERLVVMNEVPQQSTRRMTFTFPLINAARRVWILTTGEQKKAILHKLDAERKMSPPDVESYPVLGVDPKQGELTWWLDRAAAG